MNIIAFGKTLLFINKVQAIRAVPGKDLNPIGVREYDQLGYN